MVLLAYSSKELPSSRVGQPLLLQALVRQALHVDQAPTIIIFWRLHQSYFAKDKPNLFRDEIPLCHEIISVEDPNFLQILGWQGKAG
jgi:hypothetical protein